MLTINVSEFFRDRHQWDRLITSMLPDLLARKPVLKIWSAGCSLGQEPYTLAMILAEQQALASARIIATDLDRGVLAIARADGPYAPTDIRGIPPDYSRKYLLEKPDGRYVTEALQRKPIFRELNLITDTYDQHYDLIVCRNVLIYFEERVKSTILRRFHAALNPGGVLFIGGTESILTAEQMGYQRVGGNFYRAAAPGAAA